MNLRVPMTPATTGPQWMPMRKRDAELDRSLDLPDGGGQLERHLGDALRVVVRSFGQAADDHVRVADGLDLLQPVALDEGIEGREDVVQHADQLGRLRASRTVG